MDCLPEELLADILHRIPPRSLAACRSVCNDWRATVDTRGMLLAVAHLVPHRLRGIYINFVRQDRPYFFSREPASPAIDASLDFMHDLVWGYGSVLDHRNGLLLYENSGTYVCNPATRRWAELPPRPFSDTNGSEYLMFDPTVSLHYNVLFFPEPPLDHCATKDDIKRLFRKCPSSGADWKHREVLNRGLGSMAWPPVSYPVQVFSSRTREWEEKRFVREHDTMVTVSDVWSDPCYNVKQYHAVYWREAFYLHCLGGFIIRFSLQKEKYLVIKTPKLDNIFSHPTLADSDDRKKGIIPRVYLEKSQQGIYYTALYKNQLRVWVLHEASNSHRVPEWELRHHAILESSFLRHYARCRIEENIEESWDLDRSDYTGPTIDINHEWDSDDDSFVYVGSGKDGDQEEEVGSITDYWDRCANQRLDLLGFHPQKEIIFFGKLYDGFAYYLSSCKLQYLGSFCPTESRHILVGKTYESFIYTPCMYDMLPFQEEDEDEDEDDDD